jgi:hypothetical protein
VAVAVQRPGVDDEPEVALGERAHLRLRHWSTSHHHGASYVVEAVPAVASWDCATRVLEDASVIAESPHMLEEVFAHRQATAIASLATRCSARSQ